MHGGFRLGFVRPGGTGLTLALRLVTLKRANSIMCLRRALPRTIVCLPQAGNLRGVNYPFGRTDVGE